MKIEDIDIKNLAIRSSAKISGKNLPVEIQELRDFGLKIPNLLKFFVRADFFNHSACPVFLNHSNKYLYLLLERYCYTIYVCLGEAKISTDDLLKNLPKEPPRKRTYDVKKEMRKSRMLRSAFVSLGSALDCLAGIIAILLNEGNAEVPEFEIILQNLLKYPQRPKEDIRTRVEKTTLYDLLDYIRPLIESNKDDCEWHSFFKEKRNLHSHALLSYSCFLQDRKDELGLFLIRKTPYFFEDDISPKGTQLEFDLESKIHELFIHQDLKEYLPGLLNRILK